MNEITDRIRELMVQFKLNQSDFAKQIGVRQPNLSAILKGERKCGEGVINKILLSFDINRDWLLTGEGNMLKSESNRNTPNIHDESAANLVPLIPATAFAGMVEGFAPDSISNGDYPKTVSPVPGALCAVPISGDSMEPEYHDGALAYIRQINDAAFIPWGHTVIIDTENGAFLKKIYPDEEDADYVWAKSINPAYPPIHIPKSSIYRIFRVLGTARIYSTM